MSLDDPSEVERFRAEVLAIFAAELPAGWLGIGALAEVSEAEAFMESWRAVLYRRGLLGVSWPEQYGGRGLTRLHQVVLMEELARAGLPFGSHNDTFGLKMVGNTILVWGTPAQKERFLPGILSGEYRWCQGFSEPDAGSDLAGIGTAAVLAGDSWVLQGQKVWTSQAHRANWIFVLARTAERSTPHGGLSLLLVPMDQPGVQVRPIRSATGGREFNEVFLDEARTAADNVVGPVHGGWKVAQSLLAFERGDEAATGPVLFRAEFDRLVRLAREQGLADDPVVRDRLARLYTEVEVMRGLGQRVLAGYLRGEQPGPEASVSKLFWSEYHQRATDLALELLGDRAQVVTGRLPLRGYRTDDPGAAGDSGSWIGSYFASRAGTIYAGTSEIQRNILADTVLGLPRTTRREGTR